MGLEEIPLGELIEEIVSRELHKHEFSRGISARGRQPSKFEKQEIEIADTQLEAIYSELNRRESQYRKI